MFGGFYKPLLLDDRVILLLGVLGGAWAKWVESSRILCITVTSSMLSSGRLSRLKIVSKSSESPKSSCDMFMNCLFFSLGSIFCVRRSQKDASSVIIPSSCFLFSCLSFIISLLTTVTGTFLVWGSGLFCALALAFVLVII